MELYLAGPMRGYVAGNAEAFTEARTLLRDMGHDVFCPSEMTEAIPGRSLRDYMLADIVWIITNAEGVVALPGWRKSKGSLAKIHLAWAIDIKVYEYEHLSKRIIKEVKSI